MLYGAASIAVGIAAGWLLPRWGITPVALLFVATGFFLRSQLRAPLYVVWPIRRTIADRVLGASIPDYLSPLQAALAVTLEEKGFWYARAFAGDLTRRLLWSAVVFLPSFTLVAIIEAGFSLPFLATNVVAWGGAVYLFGWWSPYAPGTVAEEVAGAALGSALELDDPSLRFDRGDGPPPQIRELPKVVNGWLAELAAQLPAEAEPSQKQALILLGCSVVLERLDVFMNRTIEDQETSISILRWRRRLDSSLRSELGLPAGISAPQLREAAQTKLQALSQAEFAARIGLDRIRSLVDDLVGTVEQTEVLRAAAFAGGSLYALADQLRPHLRG